MSFEALQAVCAHSKTTGADRAILLVLAHRTIDGEVWVGTERLARESGVSERHAKRRRAALEAGFDRPIGPGGKPTDKLGPLVAKELELIGIRRTAQGRSVNVYRISLPPASSDTTSPENNPTGDTMSPRPSDTTSPRKTSPVTPGPATGDTTSPGDVPTGDTTSPEYTPRKEPTHKPTRSSSSSTREEYFPLDFSDADGDHYSIIYDDNLDPVEIALNITREIGQPNESRAAGFLRNALKNLGDKRFRDCISELYSEMETDRINNPGAILTKKNARMDEAMKRDHTMKLTIQIGSLRVDIQPAIDRIIVTPSLGDAITCNRNEFEEGLRLHLKNREIDR